MTDEEIPEYIIEAEKEMFDWGYHGPVETFEGHTYEDPEEALRNFESRVQYHMGAYTASQFICNRLYKIEDFDERYYYRSNPPWVEEAVEYREQLQEEVENDE